MNYDERMNALKDLLDDARDLKNEISNAATSIGNAENADHWNNALAFTSAEDMFERIAAIAKNIKENHANFLDDIRNQIAVIRIKKWNEINQYSYLIDTRSVSKEDRLIEINNLSVDESVKKYLKECINGTNTRW
ncbi:MAG: hypothetical protein ACK5LC_06475 [Coprobacillaceae bacterium]